MMIGGLGSSVDEFEGDRGPIGDGFLLSSAEDSSSLIKLIVEMDDEIDVPRRLSSSDGVYSIVAVIKMYE